MHEFMNDNCEKCSKFSHCNNNNLICISRYRVKEQECKDWQSKLNKIKKVCEPITNISMMDKLKYMGEYILAKQE